MPWPLIAIAAIQAGYAIYNSQQQQQIAQEAQIEGDNRAIQNTNRVKESGLKRQRGAASGTLLGGLDLGQIDNQGGTLLNTAGNTAPTSLLGNNL